MSIFINKKHPETSSSVLRVAIEKSDSKFITLYSHNWCDKTTWYSAASYVEAESASDSGDHVTYTLSNSNMIDTFHGKITGEDFLLDGDGNSFRVSVTVDGVEKNEVDPHTEVGDFTVNYDEGSILFSSALTGSEAVSVSYHYATTADFPIPCYEGKVLKLSMVEVQLSEDVEIKDTLRFQPYGSIDVFAPQLLTTNGGPYPSGTKIPLGNPVMFKTMSDYYNGALKTYPAYPPLGGTGWRGCQKTTYVLDWDYMRDMVFFSSMGMEAKMSLDHNEAFGGEFATTALYCTVEDEE